MRTRPIRPSRFTRTAAALQASPEFLEKLPLAIYACDADGRLLWFNARAVELWGRTPRLGDATERFCGSHQLYFDGRPIDRDETPMASVLRTGVAVRGVEGLVERPDGSSIWCMVHIEPVEDEDGTLIGAINCFHETTGLHQAEALLHEQDERLAVTYEHAGIGIAEVDAAGILLRVNARLCGLMGFSADQLQGRSIFDETFPEDRDRDRAQFLRQTAGEIDRYTIEKRVRRSDGTYAWVAIASSSVRDAQGQFLYAVRVQNDINDRKRAEESLARRMDEQAALYAFTERLQHAQSLQDVYEPALDAIIRALRCQRASILLLDDAGAMRFVAWRGLSDAYRRAVDGHSPGRPTPSIPQPVCLADIDARGAARRAQAGGARRGHRRPRFHSADRRAAGCSASSWPISTPRTSSPMRRSTSRSRSRAISASRSSACAPTRHAAPPSAPRGSSPRSSSSLRRRDLQRGRRRHHHHLEPRRRPGCSATRPRRRSAGPSPC